MAIRLRALRVATLLWPRDDHGITDYANPAVIPLETPRIEEVFQPIDKRTHKELPDGSHPDGPR